MRGYLWIGLVFFVFCGNAMAVKLTPYISGSLQYDIVFAHYGMRSATSSGWLHDFGCWGSQFDVGVKGKDLTVYFGYHYSSSPLYTEWEHWFNESAFRAYTGINENSWREKRYLLGSRWTMNSEGHYTVQPAVGVALTYGISRLEWDYIKLEQESTGEPVVVGSSRQLRHSRRNWGAMFEFGFLIHPLPHVDICTMAQVHRFESKYRDDHDPISQDHYVVIMPSMEISLQYLFPTLKIGE
jgi:hypothetical protein